MPELPEVETVRRSLERAIVGRRIATARLVRRDVVKRPARPHAVGAKSLLAGARVERLTRHGKQLAIVADDGRTVCVHLGMSGAMLLTPAGERAPDDGHVHARWTLDNGCGLIFRDPRRFGGLWCFPSPETLISERWSRLGPDALRVTPRQLAAGLGGRRCPVKAALLDQGTLAGVGNIYADEALFRAAIDPRTPAARLGATETARLAGAIRTVLRQAIVSGGSTIRSYTGPDGQPGRQQERHLVYGRAGRPCPACGRGLVAVTVAQRTTVLCETCQGERRPEPAPVSMGCPHRRRHRAGAVP